MELAASRWRSSGPAGSAIQTVPAIQPDPVERVTVYQRSPGWTIRKMDDAYSPRAQRLFERFPAIQRLDRRAIFAFMDLGALAMTKHRWLMPPFRAVAKRNITKAIKDPELLRKVTPTDEVGCKRIMLTDEWYPTLTRPNVDLVTEHVAEITASGVRTSDGVERPADVLVLATGFKSHGFVAPMAVTGVDGRTSSEAWQPTPRAYLGMSVPGFDMFLLYGPNTNGGTGSVIDTIEAGMNHVLSALTELAQRDARRIEIRRSAADAFDRELKAALAGTVWHTGCTSWYVDAKGNDPNQWPWSWTGAPQADRADRPGRVRPRALERVRQQPTAPSLPRRWSARPRA